MKDPVAQAEIMNKAKIRKTARFQDNTKLNHSVAYLKKHTKKEIQIGFKQRYIG